MKGIQWPNNLRNLRNLRNLVVCLAICCLIILIKVSNTFAEPNMGLTGIGRTANLKNEEHPQNIIASKEIK